MRRIIHFALVAACGGTAVQAGDDAATATKRQPDVRPTAPYATLVSDLEVKRRSFATRLATTSAPAARRQLLAEARATVLRAIADRLIPAWVGTPWAMNGTATEPGEQPIACGYFVATILRDAGVPLHRVRFGQAAALRIQEAMTPPGRDVHRFLSIPPATLARRIAALGDGLYIIGLNVHVGFVQVDDGEVSLLHSSYTGDRGVTIESFAEAAAIENSQEAGYFVSELFSTDEAVVGWIEQREATLPAAG